MSKNKWDIAIAEYKSYLRIERALSRNTIESYCSDIEKLAEYIGKDTSFDSISVENLRDFVEQLVNQNISKRSQSRIISSLRSFFNFLTLEQTIKEDPTEKLSSPKIGRYIPEVLSVEEVSRIIDSVDLSKPEGHRNKAMLELLYSCGLRVSELVDMRISDLFLDEGFIRVIGKGDKQRLVPIGDYAKNAIRLYLSSPRIFKKGSEDILFLNRRGSKLTRVMVFLIVKTQAEIVGITKEISPHTFRHTFATHLVENGADLRTVQQMLGHESILTTEIYTHINAAKWQEGIIKYHPRGNDAHHCCNPQD